MDEEAPAGADVVVAAGAGGEESWDGGVEGTGSARLVSSVNVVTSEGIPQLAEVL